MKTRLDQALVERGLAATRSRARDLILRGHVSVAGAVMSKPAAMVEDGAALAVDEDAGAGWVSRGALKLAAGIDAFGFEPAGRVALDVGASTGGFTEVLLTRGASRVYAVDVGHGQLHPRIAADPRVVVLEDVDARDLDTVVVPDPVGVIVADVSFISLAKALPAALALAAPGAWLVALVKPQFEAGRDAVGRGGIVRDPAARERALAEVASWFAAQDGWRITGTIPSPIAGGSGNAEYLIGARRDE